MKETIDVLREEEEEKCYPHQARNEGLSRVGHDERPPNHQATHAQTSLQTSAVGELMLWYFVSQ